MMPPKRSPATCTRSVEQMSAVALSASMIASMYASKSQCASALVAFFQEMVKVC
jgi:hypothetical protein